MNGISPEGLEFIRQVKLPEELGLLRKIGTIPLRFESVSLMSYLNKISPKTIQMTVIQLTQG